MFKMTPLLVLATLTGLTVAAAAAEEHGNANGTSSNPQSSTAAAAAPEAKAPSPGTVGGMKDAGGGSFTASDKDQKGVHLDMK